MSRPPQQLDMHRASRVNAEAWLIYRLGKLAKHIEDGVTTPEIRRDRLRALLIRERLEMAIAGRGEGGKPETFARVFERIFGEPLITEEMRAEAARLRSGER